MRFVLVKKKQLIAAAVAAIVFAAAICAVAFTGSAQVYSGKTTRKLPIYSVATEEKCVALSFDASWGADKTLDILAVLERYDIRANFFVVGFWAKDYAEKLKTLNDSGRVEIGTHSNNHPHMPKLSKSQMELELTASNQIIEEITGKKVELFRPPFGDYSDTMLDVASSLGLYTIQWDVDTLDWKGLKAADMAQRVLNKATAGSIVLMHNDGEHTVEALPLIIEGLKNKGFTFKTIGEMIYRDNYTIDHTGKQIPNA